MTLKVKLTPLNIVSALCLVIAGLLLFSRKEQQVGHPHFTMLLAGVNGLAAVTFFISDLIFRRFIPSLKKLWVVEGVLVVFILVLVLIITSSLKIANEYKPIVGINDKTVITSIMYKQLIQYQ